jgi:ABC-2 type transport system ATP-binding protein
LIQPFLWAAETLCKAGVLLVRGIAIQKSFRHVPVLKHSSFEVKTGAVTALAGPNGAGKTTLLKIVAQILRVDAGELVFAGDAAALREKTGYVPQQNAFFYELTARENLSYWQKGRGGFDDTVELLGLGFVLHKKASALSGGMQRRLNMAIALLNSPEFLIMDEPLTGVDITGRLDFLDFMLKLKQKGMTILYSTHHTDEIAGVADELILLNEGEVVFCGPVAGTGREIDEFIINTVLSPNKTAVSVL